MTIRREDIIARIRENLERAGLPADAEVLAQRDPYSNRWHIAVICEAFADKTREERKGIALKDMQDVPLAWLDLITPEEKAWAGPLPGKMAVEELPLWPESMARGNGTEDAQGNMCLLRVSDMDADIQKPVMATFYSLRGGVGRSTALVCTARLLARSGLKVVCVDMDLEAPALPALFGLESEVSEEKGVVELLLALDEGQSPDFSEHLLPVEDNLFVLPAGLVGAGYARKLRYIQPVAWYSEDRNPLRMLSEGLCNDLPFRPDVVLFDARTGITDLSGPLLFDLSDVAVVVFFPHPQAKKGTELLVRSLLASSLVRTFEGNESEQVGPDIRFLVSPLPATSIPEVEKRYKQRPLEWIASWLSDFNDLRKRERALPQTEPSEITHFVPYREEIATSDAIGRHDKGWKLFEPVADWIRGLIAREEEERWAGTVSELKPRVLQELVFASGQAELQQYLLEDFVKTEKIIQALSPEIVLVRGRKGTGKTALFRYLSEHDEISSLVVHAPPGLDKHRPWIFSPDHFAEAERIIDQSDRLGWRHFWAAYVLVAIYGQKPGLFRSHERAVLDGLLSGTAPLQTAVLNLLRTLGSGERSPVFLDELLAGPGKTTVKQAPGNARHPLFLLFDGLDTGFGSTEGERKRRRRSLEGLFDFWMHTGQRLDGFSFKILLREDIWRQLKFQNRSHLYGRDISLQWANQVEFLKVPLKQTLRSETFKAHEVVRRVKDREIENWSEQEVYSVWNVLVGERMKGAATAFTRNWVWNRLADANGDHSPRYLVQLLHEALEWERNEHPRRPYDKAFIRPRALIMSLEKVSEQAFQALEEEFNELEELFKRLKQIRRTPLSAQDLKRVNPG